jgi:hypothetical protein
MKDIKVYTVTYFTHKAGVLDRMLVRATSRKEAINKFNLVYPKSRNIHTVKIIHFLKEK